MIISTQKIKKIMQQEGAERISAKAAEKLNNIIEESIRQIIKKAKRNAEISGRVTLKEEDIKE